MFLTRPVPERASLVARFRQLNAPESFHPGLNIPLRWSCVPGNPDIVALFDPECNTGFVLRIAGGGVDVAFHLDGRIARAGVGKHVVVETEEKEKLLESILNP